MRLPPCKHPEPQPTKCPWCKMAMTRDPRYALEWWGMVVNPTTPLDPIPMQRRDIIKAKLAKLPCIYRGGTTGETRECEECGGGRSQVEIHFCSKHQECTVSKTVRNTKNCITCNDYTLGTNTPSVNSPIPHKNSTMIWSYGVTTVPSRRNSLLPRTLESLKLAGFPTPRLFIDGCKSEQAKSWEDEFQLEVTPRYPTIRTFGNWVLTLWELYLREPNAHRYAIFQDDLTTVVNLRQYLEIATYPHNGYLNLLTFPENEARIPTTDYIGFYESRQNGKGAVALVFSREAVQVLLSSRHMADRPIDPKRGWQAVDGGIVTGMGKLGWKEYVHSPSLVVHTGDNVSVMGHKAFPAPSTFPGPNFDALELLKQKGQ